ncbi:hypothetical protein ABI59_07975 [Acidobacteria bacterium Mor1]|nr:hypothetical protein ABI59_07975 [Acidobacteria bacterium Mor1]
MAIKVLLEIEGEFCGPANRGTVRHIQVLREVLGVSLAQAKELVDRCVFEGETVKIEIESEAAATRLIAQLEDLENPPRTRAWIDQ